MRKVRFTQQNFHDKLTAILDGFPRLDDIHPFYADLMNVLYSRDHYKLALGQLNICRQLINKIGKDYVQLLKFGDSLYRCKTLKRAALGRMATCMKKNNASLCYLEQVRTHLSRLPSIDPMSRTLMICGYPNVGKSSFINKISRADVEVEPYAFTTKSLYVGHCDYKYMRWQVIDTPGILDHPLEDRNTIEMQAVTALAHLQSVILFFVDISTECGYSIKDQVSLYHSIKPLFQNKPTLIVLNKIDVMKLEELDAEDRGLIDSMSEGKPEIETLEMSALTEVGVSNVKNRACDILLNHRVEKKLRRTHDILNRIQVQQPIKRDTKTRAVCIPASVLARRKNKTSKPKRKTQKDYQEEGEGAGLYDPDRRLEWISVRDEWKHDIIPEFLDGKNIVDFIDPEIAKRLDELEAEEEILEKKAAAEALEEPDSDLEEGDKKLLQRIRLKRDQVINQNLNKSTNNKPVLPRKVRRRSIASMEKNLNSLGLDVSKFRARSKSRGLTKRLDRGRKRVRSLDTSMADVEEPVQKQKRGRSRVRNEKLRSASLKRSSQSRDQSAYKNAADKKLAEKITKLVRRPYQQDAREGESDRRFYQKMPKHLFSGKRGMGKTDRR